MKLEKCNILENYIYFCTCKILKRYLFLAFLRQNIAKEVWHQFFDLQYLWILHIVETTNDIFGIMRKFWVRNLCFYAKYWFENLAFLPDLDLTSIKSKLWWRHRVKWPSLSISTCKMTQKTCVARHVCDFDFLVNF